MLIESPHQNVDDAATDLATDPAPIISGTICLMSCAITSLAHVSATSDAAGVNPFYARRITGNLALLAEHPALDMHFRRVCRRLFDYWETRLNTDSSDTRSGNVRIASVKTSAPTCACAEALAAAIKLH
jgi:hypothetical protein